MDDFKKRYLINAEQFNKLQKIEPDNKKKQISEFQTNFFQDKIGQMSQDDLLWGKLEKRLSPILAASLGQPPIAQSPKGPNLTGQYPDVDFNSKYRIKGKNFLGQIKKLPNVTIKKK